MLIKTTLFGKSFVSFAFFTDLLVNSCNKQKGGRISGHSVVGHCKRSPTYNNNNSNNKHICKAPLGRNFRGAGGSQLCVL